MKVVLISPKGPLYRKSGGIFRKSIRYQPLTLTTLAALAPPELNIAFQLFDEGTGDVPLDIVAFSGKISREQWVIAATGGETISLLAALFGGQSQSDVFATPLSKKAAFRMFESPWAKAEPGQYTVILDNTQAYTPSRGDAFVKLELYSTQ